MTPDSHLHVAGRIQQRGLIQSPNARLALPLILILLALVAVFPPFFGLFAAA